MALSITSNHLSLTAQCSTRTHDAAQARFMARLVCGMRIDGTGDDVASQDDAGNTARLTRAQILQEAASAMLAPVNGQSRRQSRALPNLLR